MRRKIIVKLFASSWYIFLLIHMMHGHTYIKDMVKLAVAFAISRMGLKKFARPAHHQYLSQLLPINLQLQ